MSAQKQAKKEAEVREVELDNGIKVLVRKLGEQDRLRAAAIFNPRSISRAERKTIKAEDAIDLWNGNEAYTLWIVDRACTLLTEMPGDTDWLRPIRRNSRAFGIQREDLEDEDYLPIIYIRFHGMTTDEFIGKVTDVAMDIKDETGAKTKEEA